MGSSSLERSLKVVDLPQPEPPTNTVKPPAGATKETSVRASFPSFPEYVFETPRKTTAGARSGSLVSILAAFFAGLARISSVIFMSTKDCLISEKV